MKWAVVALLISGSPAVAGGLHDVDVTTQSIDPGKHSARIVFTVSNGQSSMINARVRCSLYDKSGAPLGEAGAWVEAIPPGDKAVSEASADSRAAKADCRVTALSNP